MGSSCLALDNIVYLDDVGVLRLTLCANAQDAVHLQVLKLEVILAQLQDGLAEDPVDPVVVWTRLHSDVTVSLKKQKKVE